MICSSVNRLFRISSASWIEENSHSKRPGFRVSGHGHASLFDGAEMKILTGGSRTSKPLIRPARAILATFGPWE